MDTVSVAKRRDGLREKLDAALGTMHRAASAAVLKGDPLAEQLQALAASIDALAEIYEASADTQLDIADTLRTQADVVATEAVGKVHASGVAIIDQLAPRLAGVVEKATRERLKALRPPHDPRRSGRLGRSGGADCRRRILGRLRLRPGTRRSFGPHDRCRYGSRTGCCH